MLGALSETETALSAYARELERHGALQRARDRSDEAARLARMRNEAGRDSFLVVLETAIDGSAGGSVGGNLSACLAVANIVANSEDRVSLDVLEREAAALAQST